MTDLNPFIMNNYCACNYTGAVKVRYSFQSHTIYECPACGLMFLHPQPSIGKIHELYRSEDYFMNKNFFKGANESIFGYADYFAERAYRQKQFSRIARNCMRALLQLSHPMSADKYKLLEIGCGPGFFLEEAERKGFEAHGIEFNANIVSLAHNRIADRIHVADFENINEGLLGKFNCIVMLDVIEHFREPVKVIQKVQKMLMPGGIFILSTIDSGSLSSKIIGKRLEDFRRLREHLYFFNRKNISSFLRMHNFAIDSIVSIGNTFRLDHLLNRILLMYSKPWNINSRLGTVLMKFLSRISVYLNTHTKMIVFSRKRGDDSTLTTQRIRNDLMAMGENLDYYRYYMNYVKSEFLNKTVLELGSGTGNSSGIILQMGAKSVVGVERDPDLIEIARKKMHKEEFESKIEFIHMNIDENISELGKIIRERKVDVVFHFNFIEHIKKDIDLIKAIYEALPNGGRIISIVPAGSGIYSRFDETYRHYRRYDVCDLKYRFEPFRLKYYRECALLKNIGWRLNKNNPNMEFSKYWAIYHLVFFMIDKTIDTFFGKLLPFGATFVSVHDKIKHSVSNEDK